MKKFLIPVIVAVLFGVGTFVAISGKDDNKSSDNMDTTSTEETKVDTAVNACDLLSPAEVSTIVGMEMELGTGNNTTTSDTATVSSCTYTNVDSGLSNMLVAGLLIRRDETKSGARSGFEQARESMPDAETVEGIGDEAYYSPMTKQLSVLHDNDYVIVTVTGNSNTPKEHVREMAEHVLSH